MTEDGLMITGRVDVKTHSTSDLIDKIPEWQDLDSRQRYLAISDPASIDFDDVDEQELQYAQMEIEPDSVTTDYNTTCIGMHEYFVDNLNPSNTANESASFLALGDAGGTGTATTDTTLNNETFRKSITDHSDNGDSLLTSTFIDSTEANGTTIDEVGIFTAATGGILLNHSAITGIAKDTSKTITIDVTLTFSAA